MRSIASRVRREPLASTLAAFAALAALAALGTACSPSARHAVAATGIEPVSLASAAAAGSALDLEGRAPRHTITRAEIDRISVPTAYDLVARTRPELLRRAARHVAIGSYDEPVVYVDALKSGLLSTLATVPASRVIDITYVTPLDALLRYGPTHGAGVIVVRTRR